MIPRFMSSKLAIRHSAYWPSATQAAYSIERQSPRQERTIKGRTVVLKPLRALSSGFNTHGSVQS